MNYVVESYENYKDENRLTTNNARKIEFITTTRVLDQVIGAMARFCDIIMDRISKSGAKNALNEKLNAR